MRQTGGVAMQYSKYPYPYANDSQMGGSLQLQRLSPKSEESELHTRPHPTVSRHQL